MECSSANGLGLTSPLPPNPSCEGCLLALFVASSITALSPPIPLLAPLFGDLSPGLTEPTLDDIDAYGFRRVLEAAAIAMAAEEGCSEASKKGLSAGCTARGEAKSCVCEVVGLLMSDCRARACSSRSSDSESMGASSSSLSASGEETAGACLLPRVEDAAVDASLG